MVDTTPPDSSVIPLPLYTPSTSFTVSWNAAADYDGAAITGYTVYVSDDGGAFTPWQTNTTATTATWSGQDGHTYGFYSVAINQAGLVQPTPTAAQAITLIDVAPPTSSVTALPPSTPTTSFTVAWTGSDGDNGSAVASYTVYVSDNGGAFKAWQTNTSATSATYTGTNGHSYGVYSVAIDNSGNVQATPSQAQAGTRVVTVRPTSKVSALPAFSPGHVTLHWSGSDSGGPGIAFYDVYVSDNGKAFTPLKIRTTATSITFIGQDGHGYSFYSVATDNAGNVQPTPGQAQASTRVDAVAPTSKVSALRVVTDTLKVALYWSGKDNKGGSGIATYDVYVSDNGGAFRRVLKGTKQTSAVFPGKNGHTYSFYSVATDNVGNREPAPATAQATTTIKLPHPAARPPREKLADAVFGLPTAGDEEMLAALLDRRNR